MNKNVFSIAVILIGASCHNEDNVNLKHILDNATSPAIAKVMAHSDAYELQIIFSPVHREDNEVSIERYSLGVDPSHYFYPASTVKLPVALLVLERLSELRRDHPSLSVYHPIATDSSRAPQTAMVLDSCSEIGQPTLVSLIQQVFAISDNNAYNRLYEFLGPAYINEKLKAKGIFTNSRIVTRVGVGGFTSEDNQHLNPFHFLSDGDTVLSLPARHSPYAIDNTGLKRLHKGDGYIRDGQLIKGPFDMSAKNFINLNDLERCMMTFVLPELYNPEQRYKMSSSDREIIRHAMTSIPSDFSCHKDNEDYYDSYVKFFMHGDEKSSLPDHLTIMNKVGIAYGQVTETAYITDKQNEVEFFLTATINVNENRIYNDDNYAYDSLGIPFMAELGRTLHSHLINQRDHAK